MSLKEVELSTVRSVPVDTGSAPGNADIAWDAPCCSPELVCNDVTCTADDTATEDDELVAKSATGS